MIKILIFSLLLYYVFRIIARIFTFPSRMNHENQDPKVFVYRNGEKPIAKKEKDISEKARVVED